jgi:hypothetical protein
VCQFISLKQNKNMTDSTSTVGYEYDSDSTSTIGYGYDSDPDYQLSSPTKIRPWWEGRVNETPDSTKLCFVKTWIVERKATNTSPSILQKTDTNKSTQTGAAYFSEPIHMGQLDSFLDSLNLDNTVDNTDYEVAAICATYSLSAAKVRQRQAEEQAEEMRRHNLRLCLMHHRTLCRQAAMRRSSTVTQKKQ